MSVMDEPDLSGSFIESRNARIRKLFDGGMLLKQIAVEVGMAPNSVGQILKRLGVERPSKPQKRWAGRESDDDKIKLLWSEGLCASQIAERIGVSRNAVSISLRALGLADKSAPRHRYDGIGGIGGGTRRSSGRAANYARRT